MSEAPRVCDVAENLNRFRVPLSGIERTRRQGPYRYFGAQGVIDHVDDYLFDGKYILVAEDGENLRSRKSPIAFLVSGRFWVNNHAHILRVNEAVANRRFLAYAINLFDLAGAITGAAQPKLTKANLERLPLPRLSKAKQDRVAATLGAFDELIAINERRIEVLEDLVRSVYREWFVRDPSCNEPIRDDHPGATIATVADLLRGSINPAKSPATIYEHFSIPAFDAGQLPAIEDGASIKSSKTLISGECVLLSKLNPRIPRVWFALPQTNHAITSTEFLAWRGTGVSTAWLWATFSSNEFLRRLASTAGGTSTSHQRVKYADVASYAIRPPDRENLRRFERFDAIADPALRAVALLRRQNHTLADTRDLLLPRLVTGRLDISDIDLGDLLAAEAA